MAAHVKRELARLARESGAFDARRYFRGDVDLGFYNVGAPAVRALAAGVFRDQRDHWTLATALDFADRLIRDRHLEAKALAVEVVARYRRAFAPPLLRIWKRWLGRGDSSNWATTDTICGRLIGPLLVQHPALAARVGRWARDRNMWVRRASAVSLIPSVRHGAALDVAYIAARALHRDSEDLIQKAVGWLLREAGKADMIRLERYLRQNGAAIPRTTLRYAIERFPERKRRALLNATRPRAGREPRAKGHRLMTTLPGGRATGRLRSALFWQRTTTRP